MRRTSSPKLRKDPDFINHYQNIRVYRASEPANECRPQHDRLVQPGSQADATAPAAGSGPENALGPAKFLFPNPYDVLSARHQQAVALRRAPTASQLRLHTLARPARVCRVSPEGRPELDAGENRCRGRGEVEPRRAARDSCCRFTSRLRSRRGSTKPRTVAFRPDVYGRDQKEAAVAERGGKSWRSSVRAPAQDAESDKPEPACHQDDAPNGRDPGKSSDMGEGPAGERLPAKRTSAGQESPRNRLQDAALPTRPRGGRTAKPRPAARVRATSDSGCRYRIQPSASASRTERRP